MIPPWEIKRNVSLPIGVGSNDPPEKTRKKYRRFFPAAFSDSSNRKMKKMISRLG